MVALVSVNNDLRAGHDHDLLLLSFPFPARAAVVERKLVSIKAQRAKHCA